MNRESRGQESGARDQMTILSSDGTGPRTPDPGPLRILMIAPTPYFSDRGCHVRIYEEAKALTARGHQVRIVTYHLGRDLEPVPVERTLSIPWYTKREAGPSWHKLYLDLLLFCKVAAVAKKYKPDVIHAHLHEGVLIGWPVARLHRIPLLFDYQGSLTGESLNHGFFAKGSLLHRLFRGLEKGLDGLADLVVTSSTPGMQELKEQWQMPLRKLRSLPDGVDTSVFRHLSRRETRQQLGLDDEVPVIVFLGLLNRYQGIDLLLQAVRLLIRHGRIFHLLVMGYPEAAYRKKAEQLNIGSFVTFTGRIDYAEAPLMLAAGDLAVAPKVSDTEANGKLLNYMACGLPVVAFDTPVNRELLGDDGLYAGLGDAEDLANCLSNALSDREQLRQRGRLLRERAVEQFSWSARVLQLEQLYRDMLTVEK